MQPASPMMAAVRQLRASGSGTTQSAGTTRVGGEAAVPVHTRGRSPAPGHAVPAVKSGLVLSSTLPASSTPGDEWKDLRHTVPRSGHHGVLEVDGGPLDPDEDFAGGKVGVGELDDRAVG